MAAVITPAAAPRRASPGGSPVRWLLLPVLALLIVLLLVILMHWMIRSPEGNSIERPAEEPAQLVRVEAPKPKAEEDAAPNLPQLTPPPPPSAPPAMARPALPAIAVPSIAIAVPQVDVANVGTGAVNLGAGLGLGSTGVFGGFAGGGGNGNGGGGGGGGGGKFGRGDGGFQGRELVPLSTARPQMPPWACKQKLKGWVEVVFVVTAGGRVENVRIVDAQPRGVYEAAAIESVSNWIYPRGKQAAEVKQRVEMDPEDCAYNYNQ